LNIDNHIYSQQLLLSTATSTTSATLSNWNWRRWCS